MSWRRWGLVGAITLPLLAAPLVLDAVRLPGAEELRSRITSRYSPGTARSWTPLWAISPQLRESVVIWEDPAFYHHSGVSLRMILGAVATDVKERRWARGGSTITQQVAKNLFLTREKTLRRKWRDALVARRLERVLSKDEILEVYLNTAEWGESVHGAREAARFYFGLPADRLDWAEAALLASVLPNPRALSPCGARADTAPRRDLILGRLHEEGRITREQHDRAVATPVVVRCRRSEAPGRTPGRRSPRTAPGSGASPRASGRAGPS